jgi:hypothetical protein
MPPSDKIRNVGGMLLASPDTMSILIWIPVTFVNSLRVPDLIMGPPDVRQWLDSICCWSFDYLLRPQLTKYFKQ